MGYPKTDLRNPDRYAGVAAIIQPDAPHSPDISPARSFILRALATVAHLAVILYVCTGWTAQTRLALLVYCTLLPLIIMQWLFNRGSSLIINLESMARTGHWRDPSNPYEGHLFQVLLSKVGIRASQAQIGFVLTVVMLMFWIIALFRMMILAH